MKKWFCIPLLTLLILCGCSNAPAANSTQEGQGTTFFAMDTVIDLKVYGSDSAVESTALQAATDEIERLDSLLSRHDENSAISLINRSSGTAVTVDDEVLSLLEESVHYSNDTSGAFDITVAPIMDAWNFTGEHPRVPADDELKELLQYVGSDRITFGEHTVALDEGMSIDLGGIAKGYASDCLAAVFAEHEISSGKVSLGGNVYVCGTKPDGSFWRIAVEDPYAPGNYLGVLSLSDRFAITSGGYQRYFEQDGVTYYHIIDPKTGDVARNGLVSVTIICQSGIMGDALSTALFVMGYDNAVEFWRTYDKDFDMILCDENGHVYLTEGLKDSFDSSLAEHEYEYIYITKN